jgi:hypothetical protein
MLHAMVGRWRVLGLERALAPGAVAGLVLGGSCFAGCQLEVPPDAGSEGGLGFAGAVSAAGGSLPVPPLNPVLGFSGTSGVIGTASPCVPPPVTGTAVFAEQIFFKSRLARRELFSWTTDEQAAELRRDRVLFARSERPGLGPGYAFGVFAQIANDGTSPPSQRSMLASLLGGELFEKVRYAWSEPWATRMGWPGEDYGGNLLRIVLKPEAWVVVVENGDLSVFDLQNQSVSLNDALANPTRLGAIFYERDASAGGPSCNGSFNFGSNGYREFIVGNLAMVEEWSLGTQYIRERLSANVQQLTTFLQRIRGCPITSSAQQWNLSVVCRWDDPLTELTELSAYEQSLAIPSDNYLAVPERIATMIETLQGDLFDPDPLVVTPGSP